VGDYLMPSLGADMDSGTVVEWLVKPGDQVRRGDIVAVIDTEKSTIEAEIFEDGVIEEILVPVGEEVPVGTPLARIGSGQALQDQPAPPVPAERAGEDLGPAVAPEAGPPTVPVLSPVVRHLAESSGVDIASVAGSGPGGTVTRSDVERAAAPRVQRPHVRASPRARRLATHLDVALEEVTGSGPGGAVTAEDVEGHRGHEAAPRARPPGESAHEPKSRRSAAERQASIRRATGAVMARSKREIPHYYLSATIDMSAAMSIIQIRNLDLPVAERLLPAALLLKATALAARAVPELNGFWVEDNFTPSDSVHLGVAVSLRGGGLVAPAIHHADQLGLQEMMGALKDVVARARSGQLRSSEMADPTITVTNLGDQGVEAVFGVIYPPQVALVGFGRVVERPWAVDGMIGVRSVVTATLSADHRASDGHRGARLLSTVDKLLQKPEEL
jgi:pyruvate dehydrogenase E2 component (dihydrolipoamide acetyltransferase)